MGVSRTSNTHVQAIMGPQAEQINVNIKANIGAELSSTSNVSVKKAKVVSASQVIKGITSGTVKDLSSMDNGAFAAMGKGVAISPESKTGKQSFYAPFDGDVTLVFRGGHAYGFKASNGVEVLIHIGVDSVNANGKGIKSAIKQGSKVKAGDLIATVDMAELAKHAKSLETAVVVTSGQNIKDIAKGKVTKATKLFVTK